MLQKMEELQRDTLSALNLAHGTTSTDSAPASRNPSTSSSMGSARDRSNSNSNRNNSCYATTLALGVLLALLAQQYKYCSYKSTNTATTAAPRQRCFTSAVLKSTNTDKQSSRLGALLELYWYNSTNTDAHKARASGPHQVSREPDLSRKRPEHLCCNPGINIHTHTHTHTHAYAHAHAHAHAHTHSLLAVLVQNYKS
jgi:hypothetical protein